MRGLLLASLLISAAPAHAAGINLAWDDCYAGAGVIDKSDDCTSTGVRSDALILSVGLSAGDVITDVNGAQGVIEIEFDGNVVPDYWRLESGGCYEASLSMDLSVGSANPPFSCPEPWSQVEGTAGGAVFRPFEQCNNRARILWIQAIPGTATLDALEGLEWYLTKIEFVRNSATNCSGCSVAACFVANEIRLTKPADIPGGDVFINRPASSLHVNWQGGLAGCPGTDGPWTCPTPVQSHTWGTVKSLYR